MWWRWWWWWVDNPPPVTGIKLGGVVAAGAPVIGSVVAKDSTGKVFGPATISADGSYSLTVTGGTAPFILQATGNVGGTSVEVYSAAPNTTDPIVNITPLTNVMVAQATGSSPATLFSSCSTASCAAPSQAKVNLAVQQVQALLQSLLTQFGITGTVNVLTDALVAGAVASQSPIDKMMDAVSIQPTVANDGTFEVKPNPVLGLNTATVLVTIAPPATGGVTTVTSTPLTVDPSLTTTVVSNATTSLTALQAIQAQFNVLTVLYATAQPPSTDPTLVALFDTAWLDWGRSQATQLTNMTGVNGPVAGNKWGSVVATAPRTLGTPIPNDATHQWFKVTRTAPNGYSEVIGPILATNIAGTWVFSGNRLVTPNLATAAYPSVTNLKTVNYATVTDSNSISSGLVNLAQTTTGGLSYTTATGLSITTSLANPTFGTFTGTLTLNDGVNPATTTTVNGQLTVREDESVEMKWKAVNTLTGVSNGSLIYSCSTTNGIGCKPVNSGLVGTWKMSQYADGTPASIRMVLLDDNRFMFLSTNTGGCQQMESGRYGYSTETSLLTLTVEYDTNSGCGVLQTGSPTVAAPVTIYRTFTKAGVMSSIAGGVNGSFTKQAQTSTEVGTWVFAANTTTDFALLVNDGSGMYVYAEAPSQKFPNPVTSGRGMEYGSYTATASTYTFGAPTYDGNTATSGVNAVAGTALNFTSTDINHIALTLPDSSVHPMVRQ